MHNRQGVWRHLHLEELHLPRRAGLRLRCLLARQRPTVSRRCNLARRARGEGTIYKRKDGRYEAQIWTPAGRRVSFYGRTQGEVRDKLTAAREQLRVGAFVEPDKQTLGDYLRAWLEQSARPAIRPTTYRSYEQLLRVHVYSSALDKRPLQKVTPQAVQAFLNDRLAAGLSPRTVQYLHGILRRALSQALRWEMVPRNAAALVDPPRVERAERRPLDLAQASRLLAAATEDRLHALYAVCVPMGLRQGEILGLRWEDVDLEGGTLTVNHAMQRAPGGAVLAQPKSEGSRRLLVLPAFAVRCLRQHRVRQLEERLAAGVRWQDTGHVFTTKNGTPILARNLVRSFKALLQRAGLPDIRFHDLRHTSASLLVAQGVHPRIVMQVLGHSQISLSMDVYSHAMIDSLREAAAKMDEALGQP